MARHVSREVSAAAGGELAVGTDDLTGLATRFSLRAGAHPSWLEAVPVIGVAVIDIDEFGTVLDAYGTSAGDGVLREVAARLRAVCGGDEVWLLRTGDDDFCLIFHAPSGSAAVRELVDGWVAAVFDRPFRLDGRVIRLTAAAGIAVGAPAQLSELMWQAAVTARALPADGVALHRLRPSLSLPAAEMEQEIGRALEGGELVAYYQPVVALDEEHVVSLEALARWVHPVHGVLSAAEFIPTIEASSGIRRLDRMMLEVACAGLKQLVDEGCSDSTTVAVNVSAPELGSPGFTEHVADTLESLQLSADRLVIELTETTLIDNPTAAAAAAEELRELGVGLFVDDFGTAYASLSYLQQLPVSGIKIDRSFITNLGSSGRDAAIVASLVGLAKDMSLTTVAEGVETVEQVTALRALGCERAQGFLWSDAVSVEQACDAIRHLDARRWQRRRPPAAPASAGSSSHRMIAEMDQAGSSVSTIAAALNRAGLRTSDGRRWKAETVIRVLRAPTGPAG